MQCDTWCQLVSPGCQGARDRGKRGNPLAIQTSETETRHGYLVRTSTAGERRAGGHQRVHAKCQAGQKTTAGTAPSTAGRLVFRPVGTPYCTVHIACACVCVCVLCLASCVCVRVAAFGTHVRERRGKWARPDQQHNTYKYRHTTDPTAALHRMDDRTDPNEVAGWAGLA